MTVALDVSDQTEAAKAQTIEVRAVVLGSIEDLNALKPTST